MNLRQHVSRNGECQTNIFTNRRIHPTRCLHSEAEVPAPASLLQAAALYPEPFAGSPPPDTASSNIAACCLLQNQCRRSDTATSRPSPCSPSPCCIESMRTEGFPVHQRHRAIAKQYGRLPARSAPLYLAAPAASRSRISGNAIHPARKSQHANFAPRSSDGCDPSERAYDNRHCRNTGAASATIPRRKFHTPSFLKSTMVQIFQKYQIGFWEIGRGEAPLPLAPDRRNKAPPSFPGIKPAVPIGPAPTERPKDG
jgi:hypothetical protein